MSADFFENTHDIIQIEYVKKRCKYTKIIETLILELCSNSKNILPKINKIFKKNCRNLFIEYDST